MCVCTAVQCEWGGKMHHLLVVQPVLQLEDPVVLRRTLHGVHTSTSQQIRNGLRDIIPRRGEWWWGVGVVGERSFESSSHTVQTTTTAKPAVHTSWPHTHGAIRCKRKSARKPRVKHHSGSKGCVCVCVRACVVDHPPTHTHTHTHTLPIRRGSNVFPLLW
jgi:hypothetical protein